MRRQLAAVASRTPLWPSWRRFSDARKVRREQRTFHEWSDVDDRRLGFYRQFLGPGDVAVDVGANFGNRTKVFASLGASVIAVDPHPRCAGFLREAYCGDPRVAVVQAALGATAGDAEMQMCSWPALSPS